MQNLPNNRQPSHEDRGASECASPARPVVAATKSKSGWAGPPQACPPRPAALNACCSPLRKAKRPTHTRTKLYLSLANPPTSNCRSFSLVTVNLAICLYLALTQNRSMTDMIRTTTTNVVNHASAAEAVLNGRLATSHRLIDVSAKEITCSLCMVMLSVIMSHPDNFIGSEREVLWGFFSVLAALFSLLNPSPHGISHHPPQLSI